MKPTAPIERLEVSTYVVPTDLPEADGTLEWDRTTFVVVEAVAGGRRGLGYTAADEATARLIHEKLDAAVRGKDAMAVSASFWSMIRAIRNLGRPGIVSMAISAVDAALWDLKARLLDVSLVNLLGPARDSIDIYASGGFTSYSVEQLQYQLASWVAQGIPRVKMKIGSHPNEDLERVRAAREAIGDEAQLFVDANGAYSRKEALAMAEYFREYSVAWFEEPVSSDDLEGLRLLRDRGPAGMDIAAGEYGYDLAYFKRMLDAGAVDVLQADLSRCGGPSEFLRVGALCEATNTPLSAHCCPSLHAPLACAIGSARHVEYFHDHARIEHMLFDGALVPRDGALRPDASRPGFGLELKRRDAARFAA